MDQFHVKSESDREGEFIGWSVAGHAPALMRTQIYPLYEMAERAASQQALALDLQQTKLVEAPRASPVYRHFRSKQAGAPGKCLRYRLRHAAPR